MDWPYFPARMESWSCADHHRQSKRDLGFMEGDLIECLNAGDGSWWTGRLRRDRRMVGVFPSNFVEVLPDDFRPVSRSTSPMPQSNTPSPKNTPQKSKTFRKPFEAYAKAPHYTSAKVPETYQPGSARSRESLTNTYGSGSHEVVGTVPTPPQGSGYGSRAVSPAPSFNHSLRQSHQTAPLTPSHHSYRPSLERADSPPPPAPPPHRNLVSRHGSNTSYETRQPNGLERHGSNLSYDHRSAGYHTPRMPSPCPPSPGGGHDGMTPSPLREAMDGVIEQLDALGMSRETASPEVPFDPWSPESFDMVHQRSRRKNRREQMRPQTAMGIGQHADSGYETHSGSGSSSRDQFHSTGHQEEEQQLPQLSNYVERMETRLRNMHQHSMSTGMMADEVPPPPPPKGEELGNVFT